MFQLLHQPLNLSPSTQHDFGARGSARTTFDALDDVRTFQGIEVYSWEPWKMEI